MIVTIAGGAFTFSPNDDELTGINLEFAAFDGEIGNGQFPMPDPSAAATMTTGRQFKVVEGSALLTDGLIIDNDRQRGPFRVGTQREYGVSVQDANALLDGFRIFRHRTAETDYARVMAFAAADGPAWDTTWVLNANTVTMPVKLYDSDGGWTSELIPDLIDFTGKTLFLHDKAIGGRCLHYHNLTSGHTCGLTISDVVGALSATCFAPQDPMRQRTSVDLRNDILARDQTGRTATATDSTSITTHDADGLQHQALLSLEANSQADLQLQTNAYLASFKDDRDTWTCSIGPLDDTALALIRVGDLITTTSAVMGLSASPQRIAHMRQRPAGVAPGKWMAELELGAPIRRRARVRNKAITDRIQHLPVQATGIYTVGCYGPDTFGGLVATDPSVYTGTQHGVGVLVGATSVTVLTSVSTIPLGTNSFDASAAIGIPIATAPLGFANFAFQNDGYVEMSCTIAVPSVPAATTVAFTMSFPPSNAAGSGHSFDIAFWQSGGSISVPPVPGDNFPTGASYNLKFRIGAAAGQAKVWPTTDTEPVAWTTYGGGPALTDIAGWSFGFTTNHVTTWVQSVEITNISFCVGAGGTFAYHWTSYGPVAVQETPDGATSTFTIPVYPGVAAGGYVHGTLHVFVDGIEQNKVETDPVAGTFTLSWTPASGDTVTASWVVP